MAAVKVIVTCDWCEDTETFDNTEDWLASERWWTVEPPVAESEDEILLQEDLTYCSKECLLAHLS